MYRLSRILSVLFVTWFILFNQQIVTYTLSDYVEYEDAELVQEVLVTTENTNLIENITDTYENGVYNPMIATTHSDDTKEIDKPESSSDDVIELNVGGQRITTFRSTLTIVPNSKLALLFTKDGKNSTKQSKVHFFDYNPVQFQYLLDQLRAIKRMPEISAYELNIVAPNVDVRFNFSVMLYELGLNSDRFLVPIVGTHLNLKVNSLIGWKECYRGKYNTPFDATILANTCKGKKLLVACRSVNDKNTLVVAGVGKRTDVFRSCTPYAYCVTDMKNGAGFYYVENQAWGFEGRPEEGVTQNQWGYHNNAAVLNPCDTSNVYSEYRLCWSLRSNTGRGGGDRCGSSKNLHNTPGWERLIYQTV